jgi:hypothetical protein
LRLLPLGSGQRFHAPGQYSWRRKTKTSKAIAVTRPPPGHPKERRAELFMIMGRYLPRTTHDHGPCPKCLN